MRNQWIKILVGTLILSTALIYQNCGSEHSIDYNIDILRSETKVPSFAELNTNIFQQKCNSCHNLESVANPDNNITTDFSNYQSVYTTSLTPGNPEGSPLFTFVYDNLMPASGELVTEEELALIYAWIAAGAPLEGRDGGGDGEPLDGVQLYQTYCAECHFSFESTDRKGRTFSQIQNAILSNQGNMGNLSFLTSEEIQAIVEAISN